MTFSGDIQGSAKRGDLENMFKDKRNLKALL